MKKKYKQLSLEQRYKIECLLSQGWNQSRIAEAIGVHKSTISGEFKRNVAEGVNGLTNTGLKARIGRLTSG